MKRKKLVGIVVLAALMMMAPAALAQRGMGDHEGVVRQAVETENTVIEGKIKEIVVEECENTTGPFEVGMHLLVTTGEDKQYNVHLGPAALIKNLVEPLKANQSVTVQAFRTEKMPAEDLVAVELKFDGKTVRLRNENLRPVWAGGQGRFYGRYEASPELPRWRQGYGRGYGMGYGRGCGSGFGRGMGRGAGMMGRQGRGFGHGRSQGWGQGRGRMRGMTRGSRQGWGRGFGMGQGPGRGAGWGFGQGAGSRPGFGRGIQSLGGVPQQIRQKIRQAIKARAQTRFRR